MDSFRISPIEIGRSLGVPGGAGGAGPIQGPGAAGGAAGASPVTLPFQDLLKQAVETANSLSIKSDAMNNALVQGKPVDLHRVVLAQQEAQISFDLVMQMRDKLVSAYQEILRMPL